MSDVNAERGLMVPCPCCGEPDASISVRLYDPDTFYCSNCDTEFTRDFIDRLMSDWRHVLAWIDGMPTRTAIDEREGAK